MKGPLRDRVNRSLLGLALAAAALGSTLLASVSGVLVLQATLQEAEKHASTLERDLSASLTSFQPIYEVQRQLQLAASSRELRSALLFDRSGRVLAASDNALVGRNLRQLSSADGLGDLPQHLLPCLNAPAGQGFCQEERVTSLVDGPLPWIGGDHMIRALPTPLALEGLPAFGQQGLLVIEVDLQPLVGQAARLTGLVFLAGLLPLFFTAGGLVLVVRRQLLPELLSLAQTDGLSGVFNRRAFLETASQRLTRPGVGDQAWVVALIDIDHFKTINDTYGHAAGDEVIRRMADYLNAAVRRSDLVGRLGGDEFALLVGASAPQAYELLDRLRQRVASHPWTLADGREPRLSLSIGMVECGSSGRHQLGELLQAADAALYVAKDQGRNQVMDLERQHPKGWTMQLA
jgi:diguanylate cyclase (GGDEF)-like protein